MEKTEREKLYELTIGQEQYFLSAHHTRLATYLAFDSAILGATIAGTLQAKDTFSYAVLCFGPVLKVPVT